MRSHFFRTPNLLELLIRDNTSNKYYIKILENIPIHYTVQGKDIGDLFEKRHLIVIFLH